MSASNLLGQGRTALVTGASRGIGPLIAAQIARQGSHVVLTGRSAADLKAVTAELVAEGADVSFMGAFPLEGACRSRCAGFAVACAGRCQEGSVLLRSWLFEDLGRQEEPDVRVRGGGGVRAVAGGVRAD
jgi:NAD(P)-dependent dehydrogenase (short-subunit alcohol dehydrogenase family)